MGANLASLNSWLQTIMFVVAIFGTIIATIYHLKKLGWHTRAAAFALGVSPLLFTTAGAAVFTHSHKAAIAAGLFALAFVIQAVTFA